jgi:hypothetical protein
MNHDHRRQWTRAIGALARLHQKTFDIGVAAAKGDFALRQRDLSTRGGPVGAAGVLGAVGAAGGFCARAADVLFVATMAAPVTLAPSNARRDSPCCLSSSAWFICVGSKIRSFHWQTL